MLILKTWKLVIYEFVFMNSPHNHWFKHLVLNWTQIGTFIYQWKEIFSMPKVVGTSLHPPQKWSNFNTKFILNAHATYPKQWNGLVLPLGLSIHLKIDQNTWLRHAESTFSQLIKFYSDFKQKMIKNCLYTDKNQ